MGGRPSQRSRKAELVDMIVELAGFGAEATAASGNADAAGETAALSVAVPEVAVADAVEATEVPAPDAGPAADGVAGTGQSNGSEPASEDYRHRHPAAWTAGDQRRHGDQRRGGDQRRQRTGGEVRGGASPADRAERSERADRAERPERAEGERGRWDDGPADYANRRRRRGRGRVEEEPWEGEPVEVAGYLDLREEGYGFLRLNGHLPSREDVYVSVKQVRQFGLRKGDRITGGSRPANRSEKNPALLRLDAVNGKPPEESRRRPNFEDLTPLFPDQKLRLERAGDRGNMTTRIIDLISPIGKGQRGLIVSPPKAGKTTIMKEIARSIEVNNPEVRLIVLLVDERPEEVTDMRRWLLRGEVAASTFDRPAEEHTHVAELTIERAKRLTESGEDVVIMLDGITRLARAYNLAAPATGRIMSGGVDSGALYPPKKFFGAARNMEEGGSLTILATALVETGSKMDEVIFEEFKGTGNMELRLDRRTAERRIYPAIDVDASSTRHEELLFERKQLQQVWKLRRVLSGLASDHGNGAAGLELLIDRLKTFPDNDAFLEEVARGPMGG
ncbi:MAG: transcription termination factor Rho [Acidimicrobiia bacterium]|nr:transcription termination factor Rho [Acidimicrobiia bacterium]